MQELNFTFIAIDFETTGFLPDGEIIEIGMTKVTNEQIIVRYSKLIKPLNQVPKEITLLTGITNEMLKDKPSWLEIEQEIVDFIGDNILIAHNVDFDKKFLEKSLGVSLPNLWVDTMDLARISLPTLPHYRLSYLVNVLEINKLTYHRAINDAEMTAAIFIKLIKGFLKKSPSAIERILSLLGNERNGLIKILKFIHKTAITNYWVTTITEVKVVNNSNKIEAKINCSFNDAEKFFTTDGILSSTFNNYEFRPQQLQMLKTIKEAFTYNLHALIEAGTGTGKSLAYLIPALLWSQEHKCKIIITTNTIALQEQLYQIDVPFLEKGLNCKLPVSIVKGRNNYLCLRRFHKLCNENQSLFWREKVFLVQVDNWLNQTCTGDKEEINLNSHENEYWSQISSQIETCVGNKCTYQQQCYFWKNRKEAEKNSLIITNHSLLLQDLKRDSKILPQYDYLIIDEAHNLEDEALKQLAEEVNFKYLRKIINQLVKGKHASFVDKKLQKIKNSQDLEVDIEKFEALIRMIKEEGNFLEFKLNECLKFVNRQEIYPLNEYRITQKERNSNWWNSFCFIVKDISNYLGALIHKIRDLVNQIEILDIMEETVREIRFQINILIENYLIINKFIQDAEEDHVYWLQVTVDNLVFVITPLNIGKILQEKLFSVKNSIILTSATLSVNNTFDHMVGMYGLEKEKVLSLILDSPFDYQKQSRVFIPTDLPEPSAISDTEYIKAIIESLTKLLPVVNGGILILFTSYQMLNSVYFALKKEESLAHKEILAHGKDGSRKTLIEALKNNPDKVILLGTNSFWEGIDIQGLGLTTVIIVKLPFAPPTRPVIAARLELLEKNKQNSFYKYSLPSAILRFRQGYGRLIRSRKDWGALIILDKRIISKNYGIKFIKSIPLQPVITAPTNNILAQLEQWMENKEI